MRDGAPEIGFQSLLSPYSARANPLPTGRYEGTEGGEDARFHPPSIPPHERRMSIERSRLDVPKLANPQKKYRMARLTCH